MRVLLDTHVVLFNLSGTRALSDAAREVLESASDVVVSAVTFAEVGVKASLGKLAVPPGFADAVVASGARVLSLSPAHGLHVATLPLHHKDPFDRLLVAQAMVEDLTLITSDPVIERYDVETVRAY